MHFSTNIKLLRKRRQRTQDEVAAALNMKRPTLSGYENGVALPSFGSVILFSDYFGVSIDTLIRIDLSTLRESELNQLERGYDVYIKGSKLRVLATTVDHNNIDNIELVSEKASAGYTSGFADPEYIRVLPTFQLPFLSKQKKYRTFQISGDSMLPIPDGSWITAEYVQDWTHLRNRHAYIIVTRDEGIVFKVVENHLRETGDLKLHSLNPLYKPFTVKATDIKEVWKFINYISPKLPDERPTENAILEQLNELKREMGDLKTEVLTKNR